MRVTHIDTKPLTIQQKYIKQSECFSFGDDNKYPQLIENLINISPTANNCVDESAQAIYGAGFGEMGDLKANSAGQSLNEVLRIAAREYAKHNNVFIAVNWNAAYKITSINVLPTTDIRVGVADDKNYSGKFIRYNNWAGENGRVDKNKYTLIDRYNPMPMAIDAQVAQAGGWDKYNGQILHIKKDTAKVYALSDLNTTMQDALTEGNAQVFRGRGSTKGFLNAKVAVVPKFQNEELRNTFMGQMRKLQGAENSSGVFVLETDGYSEDMSKQIYISDLASPYNDRLFEYSEKTARENICVSFKVPLALITQADNSLFGNSGEMLREAREKLFDSRKDVRTQFESVFTKILSKFSDAEAHNLVIMSPYAEEADVDSRAINKKAQANLRGTVGGVTSVTAIAEKVKAGTMTAKQGINIVKLLFGYSDKQARAMVVPEEEEELTSPQL